MKNKQEELSKLYEESKKFKTIESFINYLILKTTDFSKNMQKQIQNIKSENPYFDFVKTHFIAPNLIEKNWTNTISKKRVENGSIFEIGKNYPDGFPGIKIKKSSYRNRWLFELVDGERGQQFIKTYDKFPNKKQVLLDSIISLLLPQNISIIDVYNGKV